MSTLVTHSASVLVAIIQHINALFILLPIFSLGSLNSRLPSFSWLTNLQSLSSFYGNWNYYHPALGCWSSAVCSLALAFSCSLSHTHTLLLALYQASRRRMRASVGLGFLSSEGNVRVKKWMNGIRVLIR